jgi:acetoin utilization deacetylase AcuC-like enzyme
MKNLSIISHEISSHQDTPKGHPECAERYEAIKNRIDGSYKNWSRIQAPLATREQLLGAHTKNFLDYIDETASAALNPVGLDPDTWAGKLGVEAALRGAGGACLAVDKVMEKEEGASFSAMRPPGHHAEPEKAMGFCVYSSAAVAARHAQEQWGLERVAVLDFDVHHGNGTQACFWDDPSLFYASSHQMPLFPGTGEKSETGASNNIVNLPFSQGALGLDVLEGWKDYLLPSALEFKPNLIIISAGFDAHKADPLGGLMMATEDFATLTGLILEMALRNADITGSFHIVSILEGGYNLTALADSVASHLDAIGSFDA